jgi:hypothetical protein
MTATAQAEFVTKAFDRVFDTFREATDLTLKVQQDLFHKWTTSWPGFPKVQPAWAEKVQQFQKEWTEATTELTRKYMEMSDRQYKVGVQSLEGAFRVAEAKEPAEVREKVMELWQKSFECLKEVAQAQIQNFQAAAEKWAELAKKARP